MSYSTPPLIPSIPIGAIDRKSLKGVHARGIEVARELEHLYDQNSAEGHWESVEALLCIYFDLCPDSVLCDMFFAGA